MKPYALINPNCQNELYAINPGEIKSIGRSNDCEIRLLDPTVSRHHAKIMHEVDGTIYMWDTKSENGTYYTRNNETHRINSKTQVFSGDRINIGNKISLLLKKINIISLETKMNEDTHKENILS